MKKLISLFLVAVLVIVSLALPVFATDSYGNEIIKMADYVQYSFPEDTSAGDVYADCYFPDRWFSTEVSGENWSGGVGTFYGSTFTYEPSQDIQSYRIRPVGGNMQNGERIGDQIKNAHIIDLTAVPSQTWFHSSFQIKVNLPYGDGNIWQDPTAYAYLFLWILPARLYISGTIKYSHTIILKVMVVAVLYRVGAIPCLPTYLHSAYRIHL